MDFLILNREKVVTTSHQLETPHIVISMTEPENVFPVLPVNEYRKGILRLTFTDEDNYKEAEFFGRSGFLFNEKKAHEILNFVEKYKDEVDLIVSQCDGGISRSSGTAAALSVILNGNRSDNWIFDSRMYIPNRLVYRTLLNKYMERQGE